ncbi:MAG: 16S rRNA (cytosine(1402)-N(4))-methyltransferase RsmH, partial [Chlamydiia bacterium]|nr:16S rRNA (cytosine(1402)-N(4))-methyltransferase RsmH [Chlamydiia bacterium]
LEERKLETYLDGTLGAGGHARLVLEAHPEISRFIGIDQDPSALELAGAKLQPWQEKVTLVHDNFAHLTDVMLQVEIGAVDAMLFDLGVSSMQLDRAERGFSFMRPGPLDMRMNPEAPLTAKEIVNTWQLQELGRIFRDYGEEKFWKRAASAIVKARSVRPFETTLDLVQALDGALPKNPRSKIHPVTKIFQALRIAVNSELEVLHALLPQAIAKLKPGGVLGVITFHSLEDRIVKNVFRDLASDKQDTHGLAGLFLEKVPEVTVLTRKALVATDEEVAANPRSRSAKLRAVEKR